MKFFKNRVVCLFLALLLLIFNSPFISYADSVKSIFSSKDSVASSPKSSNHKSKKKIKIKFTDGIEAEHKFYSGDYDDAVFIFEMLQEKKNRNSALINNQLGSIYLAKGDYDKALDAFLKAHYLMNDISAFSKLETEAVSLFGSEAKKAYKGDPYEKLYNSLYVGLLLYNEGDLDNALAAFKNGILCDSDVQGKLYKSDSFVHYLFASRLTRMQGDKSLSDSYFKRAEDAYLISYPTNRPIVSEEQAQRILLNEKFEALEKLDNPKKKKKSKKTLKKVEDLNTEIGRIEDNIKLAEETRIERNKKIDISRLKDFIDLNKNVFLCIEIGKGPLKYQIGQYGQLAIFTSKPSDAKIIKIYVDNKGVDGSSSLSNFDSVNDTLFQALTRGGRQMDGILKGHAQFKQTTADMSVAFSQMSQNLQNQANQMSAANPYYDNSATIAAAGVMAAFSLIMAISSAAANPVADIRHWSLLPGNIMIFPLSIGPGNHRIKIEMLDEDGNILNNDNSEFDIKIKEQGDNIIFKRFNI